MSLVHLHLLLNHVPLIGIFFVALLLAYAAYRRSDELAKLSLVLLVGLAAVTVAVFLTGEPAEEAVEQLPGVVHAVVEEHEEAALLATILTGGLGALAAITLLRFRGRRLPRWTITSGLAGSLLIVAVIGWTASLGGRIRHTEIRGDAAAGERGP